MLYKKKWKFKLTNDLLIINGVADSVHNIIFKQTLDKDNYINISVDKNGCYFIEATEYGKANFNISNVIPNIKSNTIIYRTRRYMLSLIKTIWSIFFVSPNNFIKKMMESGIIKLVIFLMAVITFLLKKDEITQWFSILCSVKK